MTERIRGKHGGTIFARGSILWIRYGDGRGNEIRETTKSSDPKLAEKMLANRIKQVHAAEINHQAFTVPKAHRLTVAEVLDQFETHYRLHGKWHEKLASDRRIIYARFGDYRVESVTRETIQNFQLEAKNSGLGTAITNRRTWLMLRAIKLAGLPVPQVARLREPPPREGFLESWEVKRVLECLPSDVRDGIEFAWLSAWRKSEIFNLQWTDLHGDAFILPGPRHKNRKPKVLPLTGRLAELIEKRRQLANGEFVFHRGGGKQIKDFRRAWKTAIKLSGISKRMVHDLRRSAARSMVQSGVPERVCMQLGGWLTGEIFKRYAIVSTGDMENAQAKREAHERQELEKQIPATTAMVQ
jgi:integrase